MLIYPATDIHFQVNRKQSWNKTTCHKYRHGQYYNFRKNSELIENNIEDFVDYSDMPAIQAFYSLLEWLKENLPAVKNTDCMFSGSPCPDDRAIAFHCTHSSSGRLDFFIHDIECNKEERAIGWMLYKLSLYLQIENPDFRKGTFGIAPPFTEYLHTGENGINGYRICVYFDAYGNGVDDTWFSLNIMFKSIFKVLKRMSAEMFSNKNVPL